jgi:hypothetical protein
MHQQRSQNRMHRNGAAGVVRLREITAWVAGLGRDKQVDQQIKYRYFRALSCSKRRRNLYELRTEGQIRQPKITASMLFYLHAVRAWYASPSDVR